MEEEIFEFDMFEILFEKARFEDYESIKDSPGISIMRDNKGRTVLHYLAAYGDENSLSHKDSFVVKDNNGNFPIHTAAFMERKFIFSYPEAYYLKNNEGKTPFDIINVMNYSYFEKEFYKKEE